MCVRLFIYTNGYNKQKKSKKAKILCWYTQILMVVVFMENKSKAQESKNKKKKRHVCDKRKINWQDWKKENEIDENRKWNNNILLSSAILGMMANSLFVNCEYGDGCRTITPW